jgi:hypothetical protein
MGRGDPKPTPDPTGSWVGFGQILRENYMTRTRPGDLVGWVWAGVFIIHGQEIFDHACSTVADGIDQPCPARKIQNGHARPMPQY